MGWLPPYLKAQDVVNAWDIALLMVLGAFFVGGILIATIFCLFILDGIIEHYVGMGTRQIARYIYKGKFLDYLRKKRLKAGDIVAFRFDNSIVALKVTDNWNHTKTIIAKPLKTKYNDEIQVHYVSILAEAKNSFNYNEIEILDQKTMMKVLYGR